MGDCSIAVAEYLIEQGMAVNFVTRHISFAPLMESTFTNVPALQRLHQGEFALHTGTRVAEAATANLLGHAGRTGRMAGMEV